MELFEEYKRLVDKVNRNRKSYEKMSLKRIGNYDLFIERTFRNLNEELTKEGIILRTKNNNFTKNKKVFEMLDEETQIKINQILNDVSDREKFSRYCSLRNADRNDDYIEKFIDEIGIKVWDKLCDIYYNEYSCRIDVIEHITKLCNSYDCLEKDEWYTFPIDELGKRVIKSLIERKRESIRWEKDIVRRDKCPIDENYITMKVLELHVLKEIEWLIINKSKCRRK